MIEYAFARASLATVADFEGVIRTCKDNEARFQNARRVENLLEQTEKETIPISWNLQNSATCSDKQADDSYLMDFVVPGGATKMVIRPSTTFIISTGDVIVGSLEMRASQPADIGKKLKVLIRTDTPNQNGLFIEVVLAESFERLSPPALTITVLDPKFIAIGINSIDGEAMSVDFRYPLIENVTGQANQNPSEYVSNGLAEDHGCGVDGVKYFPYKNGNTVDGNGVVTEAQGAELLDVAYLNEAAATNHTTNSEDFTSLWTAPNTSVIPNQFIGPNGALDMSAIEVDEENLEDKAVYNVGENVLTDGTEYIASVYIRRDQHRYIRLSGFGNGYRGVVVDSQTLEVQINDNWLAVSVSEVTNDILRVSGRLAPVANGSFYIGLTSDLNGENEDLFIGDKIGIWGAQLELAPGPTSYIPTSGVALTRAADNLSYTGVNVHNDFVAGCDVTPFRGE